MANDMESSTIGAHEVTGANVEGGSGKHPQLKKFVRYVNNGVDNLKKLEKMIERGDRLFSGSKNKSDDEIGGKQNPTKVNKVRRKIVASVSQLYSRNPKFIGKAKRPIMVPADPTPTPQIDPATGQPMIGPDGLPITTMQAPIDPATGRTAEQDISDQIADVVAAIMDNVILESSFKAEAKACCLEAHHRPAAVIQVGYEYDQDNEKDDVYFRWRTFKKFIIDKEALIYNGVVRKCRFMGCMWTLRKSEAEAMGLKWSAMTDGKNPAEARADDDDECRDVWNVWSQELGVVAWISENASEFARDPEPWPWKIDGYPFEILKLTEDTDRQFSKPLILEAEGLQEEVDEMRETMQNKIVHGRQITLYDSELISEADISAIAGRRKDGYKAIEGLANRASPPMQVFNDDKLDTEFYAHYERNDTEMDQVLGTSANEQSRMAGTTAREIEEVSKNQGVMTSAKVDINGDFLNRVARKAVQIAKQTYTEERVTKITTRDGGRFWVKWIGADVLDEVDLSIDIESMSKYDSEIRKQVALNMFSQLKDIQGISVKKLVTDLLRENNKQDTEDYWLGDVAAAPQSPQPQGQPGASSAVDQRASLAGQVSPMV